MKSNRMRQWERAAFTAAAVFVAGSALLVGGATTAGAQQHLEISKSNRTIAITSSDKATAPAEIAMVSVGFVAYAGDEASAYAAGSKLSNAIAKALADSGIAKEDIESDSVSVAPVESYPDKKPRQFKVEQSWTVRTAATNAAKVLDVAVKAGANNNSDVSWDVVDGDALQAKAASKALQRARSVAQNMAAGLGVKLGDLVFASLEVQQGPGSVSLGGMAFEVRANKVAKPLALHPQKIERSATVYAVFAIE